MVVTIRLLERGREGVVQNLYVTYIAVNQPKKIGRVVNGGKVERCNGRVCDEEKKKNREERKGKERMRER